MPMACHKHFLHFLCETMRIWDPCRNSGDLQIPPLNEGQRRIAGLSYGHRRPRIHRLCKRMRSPVTVSFGSIAALCSLASVPSAPRHLLRLLSRLCS